jgi:hypothetical protein
MQAIELGIKTKKVVFRGEKCRRILDFSCYEIDELPFKYFDENPFCFKSEQGALTVIYSDTTCCDLYKGDIVSEKDFHRAIRTIIFCGHKLHLIDEEIKTLKKEWQGEEEFKI